MLTPWDPASLLFANVPCLKSKSARTSCEEKIQPKETNTHTRMKRYKRAVLFGTTVFALPQAGKIRKKLRKRNLRPPIFLELVFLSADVFIF
jgi:hypothetical protein